MKLGYNEISGITNDTLKFLASRSSDITKFYITNISQVPVYFVTLGSYCTTSFRKTVDLKLEIIR